MMVMFVKLWIGLCIVVSKYEAHDIKRGKWCWRHKIELLGHFFYVYQCWSIRRRINRLDKNYSGGRRLYKREDLRKSSQQLSLTLCLSQVPFFNCPLPLTLFKLKLKDQLKHFQVLRFRPLPILWSSNSGSRAGHAHLLLLHRWQKIHTFGEHRCHWPWLNTFLAKKLLSLTL